MSTTTATYKYCVNCKWMREEHSWGSYDGYLKLVGPFNKPRPRTSFWYCFRPVGRCALTGDELAVCSPCMDERADPKLLTNPDDRCGPDGLYYTPKEATP